MLTRIVKSHVFGCLFAAACLSTASAQAQTRTSASGMAPETAFYIGAGLGQSRADGCGAFRVTFAGSCDDKDTTWNIFAGYQFHRNIAVEAGYLDLGDLKASGTSSGAPFSATGDAKGFELLAVGIFPVSDNLAVYGKAGFFRWDSDSRVTQGGAVFNTSDKGTDLTLGLGVQFNFTRNLGARAEWQRYNDVNRTDVDVLRAAVTFRF